MLRRFNPTDIARFVWHLPNFVKLYVRLFRDRRVSLLARGLLASACLYVLVPYDFLPEWVPFLGQIDDIAVIILGLRGFIALCPREVVNEHVAAIDAGR